MSRDERAEREQRFCQLFESAYPALRRYASNRGLRGPDADDLVAGTLEIAWSRIDDLPRADPVPFLFGVARNLLRNKRRSDARLEVLLSRVPPPGQAPDPADQALVDGEALRRAFGTLDDDDQELLRLVAWDDLSPGQAAVVLGCSSVAARSRLHRARNRLAAALGEASRLQRGADSRHVEDESTARDEPMAVRSTPTEVK